MKAKKTWILIANGTAAHILENVGPGTGLKMLPNKVWHAPEKEAFESEQGMTNSSVGRSMHRMAPHNAPDKEEAAFAEEIAGHLSNALARGEFDNLVLTAAPKILGLLRPALDTQVKASVIAELDKDLVKTPNVDLKSHFEDMLRL